MKDEQLNNPFMNGQDVVCISTNFPIIKEYGGSGVAAINQPKQNEVLRIDEILGEFLRFDKYDTEDSFNWWKHDRFAPVSKKALTVEELIHEELKIKL